MARERGSRLPWLLILIVVGVAIVWWRQEQAKREASNSFAEPVPPVAAPSKSAAQTVAATPAAKKPPAKKSAAKKPVVKSVAKKPAVKKPAVKKPAQPRGVK